MNTAKIIPFPLERARATPDSTIRMCWVLLQENARITRQYEAEIAGWEKLEFDDLLKETTP